MGHWQLNPCFLFLMQCLLRTVTNRDIYSVDGKDGILIRLMTVRLKDVIFQFSQTICHSSSQPLCLTNITNLLMKLTTAYHVKTFPSNLVRPCVKTSVKFLPHYCQENHVPRIVILPPTSQKINVITKIMPNHFCDISNRTFGYSTSLVHLMLNDSNKVRFSTFPEFHIMSGNSYTTFPLPYNL